MKAITGLFLIMNIVETLSSSALLLTPFINQKRTEEAKQASSVKPDLFLNLTSYSGFFTVDERYGSNTFFWYFPVANKPVDKTPWIIWLQGGPGATSLAGLFDEMGPFEFDTNTLKIIPRRWSWANSYSLVYIDNPVGTGFSFTNSDEGFVRDMDTCSSYLYNALRQFLMVFPELRKAPLYIAGESYAGRYLPAFGLKILQQDKNIGALDVNMQGIIMGNPLLNRDSIANYISVYQQWGLVDEQGALAVKPLQDSYIKAIENEDAHTAYDLRNKLLNKLTDLTFQLQMYNVIRDDAVKHIEDFGLFMQREDVRQALHVGSLPFAFSNDTVHEKLISDFVTDSSSNVMNLLEHYRILIYCGQVDLTAPCVQNAQARRRYWRWRYKEEFMRAPRTPWWHKNAVVGYIKSGGHLTEILVRGAGHLVPMDKPEESFILISNFIEGYNLSAPPHYVSFTPQEYVEESEDVQSSVNIGLVISILLNVILIVSIAGGVWYGLKWKRQTEAFFYNPVDETSIRDGVLSMA